MLATARRWIVSLRCGCYPSIDHKPSVYEHCSEHGRQLVLGFSWEDDGA